MLFSNNGFGAVPITSAASEAAGSSAAAGNVAPEEAGTQTANGFCTKPMLTPNFGATTQLQFLSGAWRVRQFQDPNACASVINEDAKYVRDQKEPIFVGPFPIDLSLTGGQITTLTSPAQIGKDWAAWLREAVIAQAKARMSATQAKGVSPGPFIQNVASGASWTLLDYPAPQVQSDTQWFWDNGSGNRSPKKPSTGEVIPCGKYCPSGVLASGGHALYPSQIWYGADANGFRATFAQYANDPNTYSFYDFGDWTSVLGVPVQTQYLTAANTTDFSRNQNIPPIAKFQHPITGEDWGLWVSVAAAGGADANSLGQWSTSADAPLGAVMQVGMAPLPQESWLDEIVDALLWIPTALGTLLWDIGQWLSQLTCDLSRQTNLVKQLPKDPATQASALAALALFNKTCPVPVVLDCSQPHNVNNPACVKPPQNATPWWKRWYVVIPALGVIGYGIFKVIDRKRPAATSTT